MKTHKKGYHGPYPDMELSLYARSQHGVLDLLEQIYLQYPPLTIYGKNQRWEGIHEYYRALTLISKRKPGECAMFYVCRHEGNA